MHLRRTGPAAVESSQLRFLDKLLVGPHIGVVQNQRGPYYGLYVCMYACMSACMYSCMYACRRTCRCVCMHACMHACMHVCVYTYLQNACVFALCVPYHADTGTHTQRPIVFRPWANKGP